MKKELSKLYEPNKVEDKDKTRAELNEKYKPLLDDLQKYADILKEPEE